MLGHTQRCHPAGRQGARPWWNVAAQHSKGIKVDTTCVQACSILHHQPLGALGGAEKAGSAFPVPGQQGGRFGARWAAPVDTRNVVTG
ncbi:hypothetical protein IC229_32875 [Spirosoma sp. BT702]|uniref:Uncharacterized protein n=1 Tax=Spirosoma profusum TaxID=2771354 RepID=A0A927AW40_9BACT|nr:hypothetical protein [Spirosoma profusum]MBD2705451.1 hypothetical protein [Spirosoma profusum]